MRDLRAAGLFTDAFIQRFWSKVEKSEGCWLWVGAHVPNGYGSVSGRPVSSQLGAHRVSYEIHNGAIPDGMLVCHTCDVRSCVRPDHLFLGSSKENMTDCKDKGRTLYGARNAATRLTESDVREIRRRYAGGDVSLRELGEEYGVTKYAIHHAVRGRNWAYIPLDPAA